MTARKGRYGIHETGDPAWEKPKEGDRSLKRNHPNSTAKAEGFGGEVLRKSFKN